MLSSTEVHDTVELFLICDVCEETTLEVLPNAYDDEEELLADAKEIGWIEGDDGDHYCEVCG